jgi:hypothetical protein
LQNNFPSILQRSLSFSLPPPSPSRLSVYNIEPLLYFNALPQLQKPQLQNSKHNAILI